MQRHFIAHPIAIARHDITNSNPSGRHLEVCKSRPGRQLRNLDPSPFRGKANGSDNAAVLQAKNFAFGAVPDLNGAFGVLVYISKDHKSDATVYRNPQI